MSSSLQIVTVYTYPALRETQTFFKIAIMGPGTHDHTILENAYAELNFCSDRLGSFLD